MRSVRRHHADTNAGDIKRLGAIDHRVELWIEHDLNRFPGRMPKDHPVRERYGYLQPGSDERPRDRASLDGRTHRDAGVHRRAGHTGPNADGDTGATA
jgi:hypothetical protein